MRLIQWRKPCVFLVISGLLILLAVLRRKRCIHKYFVDKADITVKNDVGGNYVSSQQTHAYLFPVNCEEVIRGNKEELYRVTENSQCIEGEIHKELYYIQESKDCKKFTQERGYFDYPVTEEEKEFPIAFSLLIYGHIEQLERLLRVTYRPQNIYCIHVDRSSPSEVHQAVKALINCFENVFLASEIIDVEWGKYSVLEAEISCMKTLSHHKHWKYMINLTGQEFPLRTNLELVQILKAYNGSNDVQGSKSKSSKLPPSNPPAGYVIHEGSTHMVVTRGFVDFVLHDKSAVDLREWMRQLKIPAMADEHYFNTLNHNPQLSIPGAYTGHDRKNITLTRYKLWEQAGDTCFGTFVHDICTFGAGDLKELVKSKALFANKFRLDLDPVAVHCMEKWYFARVRTGRNADFDISYYENMPWVKNHIHAQ